ncbi:hypothetical protein DY926_14980 [Komagataeibacter melaceti]|uniref:Uncharacterized protein n=1 Tax=Komagataeibacter melaceti TaxID=2766577 RepID=A0A371YWX8_9PROT|nr:hypothetical protein DY926_14980 [Komagataeibacter melaceti]
MLFSLFILLFRMFHAGHGVPVGARAASCAGTGPTRSAASMGKRHLWPQPARHGSAVPVSRFVFSFRPAAAGQRYGGEAPDMAH